MYTDWEWIEKRPELKDDKFNSKWADEMFFNSDFADIFDPEENGYNPEVGYYYISENGSIITVTFEGNVILGKVE